MSNLGSNSLRAPEAYSATSLAMVNTDFILGGAGANDIRTAPVRVMGVILAARETATAGGILPTEVPSFGDCFKKRLAVFGDNLHQVGIELAGDLIDFGQGVVADIIVGLQSDQWGDPPLSLSVVNAIGVVAVVASLVVVQVFNPTSYISVYGQSSLLSKVIITASNTFGVLAFMANQCVHMIYAPTSTTHESRIVWLTMGVYVCVASMLPFMNVAMHIPSGCCIAYLNLVALNLCLHGLRQATLRQRKVILTNTMVQPGRFGVKRFEDACEALTMQGKFSSWLVANQSSATMCSSAMLWAIWWSLVMPHKPLFL